MPRLLASLLTLSIAATTATAAQSPEVRARIDAYVKALSSGSPELFDAMARENFSAELLARTADSRKPMVNRVRGDFGALTVTDETIVRPGHVELTLKGATSDMPMRLIMDMETTTPFKITQVGIQVGGPAGGRGGRGGPPPGPVAPVNGGMSTAEIATALDGYLAGLAGSGEFGGVVLVAKGGKEIFQKAYGTSDRASQAPMTRDLRFNIASIGKPDERSTITGSRARSWRESWTRRSAIVARK